MCSVTMIGRKQAFMSYYQVLVVISLTKLVIDLTLKFWLLLDSEALDFNYSAQDYQQSGF